MNNLKSQNLTNPMLAGLVVIVLYSLGLFVAVEKSGLEKIQHEKHIAQQEVLAKLAFESLLSVMRTGGQLEQIHDTILRLENTLKNYTVSLVRNQSFNPDRKHYVDELSVLSDPLIKSVFRQAIYQTELTQEGVWRYAYPIVIRNECRACHAIPKALNDQKRLAGVILLEHHDHLDEFELGKVYLVLLIYTLIVGPVLLFLYTKLTQRR